MGSKQPGKGTKRTLSGKAKSKSDAPKRTNPSLLVTSSHPAQQNATPSPATQPRDSVGPLFEHVPTVDASFVQAVTTAKLRTAQPLGIDNPHNLCYRNAALTAFLSCEYVLAFLHRWSSASLEGEDKRSKKYSIVGLLQNLAVNIFKTVNDQARVKKAVSYFWRNFCYETDAQHRLLQNPSARSWRSHIDDKQGVQEDAQQDAQEFLAWTVQSVTDRLASVQTFAVQSLFLQEFEWVTKARLVSRIYCGKCRYRVNRRTGGIDSSLILKIPTSAPDELKLMDLIDDALHEDITIKCRRCQRTSVAAKTTKFQHAPAVLMLLLSRGAHDVAGGQLDKNCAAVTIPEKLDISMHLNAHDFGGGSKITYSLSSVVSHRGSRITSGHYVSYVLSGLKRDQWFELDDATVRSTNKAKFDDSQTDPSDRDFRDRFTPYMLFYQRNFDQDIVKPGRPATNVDEGEDKDEQPTQWTGSARQLTPASSGESGTAVRGNDDPPLPPNWTRGAEGEDENPPASLHVSVTIGETKIQLPRQIISHFKWNKSKQLEIDVKLRAPRGRLRKLIANPLGKDYLEMDLAERYGEMQYILRSNRDNRAGVQKKATAWTRSWSETTRKSTDLSTKDVETARKLHEANKTGSKGEGCKGDSNATP